MSQSVPTKSEPRSKRHLIATVGSRTEFGGEVITGQHGYCIGEHLIACVGDVVRYPDGSVSVIVSGAGWASMIGEKPVALVGSHLANGDRIVSSLQDSSEIIELEGEPPINGLLAPYFGVSELHAK